MKLFNFFKTNHKEDIPQRFFKEWLKTFDTPNNDLAHLIFNDYSLLTYVIKRSKATKRQKFEKFRDAYFKSDIAKRNFPKQEIIQLGTDLGYGVIAEENIQKNIFLGEYTGVVRKENTKLDRSNKYLVRYPVKWNFLKHLVIDAEKCGNHTRFYNHSAKPNAQLISVISNGIFRMIVTSIKQIQRGSQILLDYGILYWNQINRIPNDFS